MVLTNKQLRNYLRDALANVKASAANSITNKIASVAPLTAAQVKFLRNALGDQKGIISTKLGLGIRIAVSAVAASYTGTPAGATTPVTITANTAGSAGNVTLSFTGSQTISAAITSFNAANPANQITLTSGSGTQTPTADSVSLTGGSNIVAANLLTAAEKKSLQTELADVSGQLTAKIAAGVNFSS